MHILKIGSAIALLLLAAMSAIGIFDAASPGTVVQAAQDSAQPVPRRHHAVAYDARSERVVMYGGATNEGQTLDDLWSWDGRQWTLLGRSVPSSGHLLFTDADGTLVLAGGTLGITAPWSDTGWTAVMQEPRRSGAAGTQDVPRGRFVMHGGSAEPGQTLGDTLEFDRNSWRRVALSGPPSRMSGSMAFDSARAVSVLFGGAAFDPARRFDDLWEWDGVRWRQPEISSERPAGRSSAAMAYDSARREIVLFGGFDGERRSLADTWLWNGSRWRRAEVEGPPARHETYMAFDAARGVVVLFGGDSDTESLGDTWEWDGSRWTRCDMPSTPCHR
jgi:hypothetical protein